MYYMCCVTGCESLRRNVKFHAVPRPTKRKMNWLNCLGLTNLSESEIKNSFVCHKHFEAKYVTKKMNLRSDAYPSLFTPVEILTGVPENCVENTSPNCNEEHNYFKKRVHIEHPYSMTEDNMRSICLSSSIHKPTSSELEMQAVSYENQDVSTNSVLDMPVGSDENQDMLLIKSELDTPALCDENEDIKPLRSSAPEMSEIPAESEENQDELLGNSGWEELPNETNILKSRRVAPTKLTQKVKDLPDEYKNMYIEYKKAKRALAFAKRKKVSKKTLQKQTIQKLLENMNPYGKVLVNMQFKQIRKKGKGRRFTDDEKVLSLAILRQSHQTYKFLQHILLLPSITTLNKFVTKLSLQPEIDMQLFDTVDREKVDNTENYENVENTDTDEDVENTENYEIDTSITGLFR